MKKELLDILACPKCKKKVELSTDEQSLLCHACQLSYAVRDGIPVMIIEEATPFSPEQSS
ncbi:MAG: Trm112 family protein [Candidatus Electrothrix sp. EH2]|nr:Trm112 family protein [Candidatus Electrothrix sp. EH2]